jgi:RHS repeat-associated protein
LLRGERTSARHELEPDPSIQNWYGGLVDGMRDASGQMYMRNRYYDPATGQFTQSDPIGLAGGLNAYGFAAGDRVSYSDPYGLSPCLAGPIAMRVCIAAISVTGFAAGRALEQVANNYSSGRPLGEGVGSAALRGANEGAVAALGGEAAGALAARVGVRAATASTASASTTAAASRTLIREGDAVLGIVHEGKLIQHTSNVTLGHTQFIERTIGTLPAGAEAVTIGKFQGEIMVTRSRVIHGRAMPASKEAFEAAKAVFR